MENGNGKDKKSALAMDRENGWNLLDGQELALLEKYAADYMEFISTAKTERKAHDIAVALAEKCGFKNIENCSGLKTGDRIYRSYRGRTLLLARIGKRPVSDGVNIVGGHIDAPRLDLKPNPLYEDSELAMLDTHYYGGIKKYQWVTIPLAMHGVVVRKDGTSVTIEIGENLADPVLVITDLLPHLGQEQAKKTLSEAITGEGLNVLVGSRPLKDCEFKSKVKESILTFLNEKYGMVEEDFNSADIELVPAGPARELGLDRSLILGYGQDDRICAYAALRSILDLDNDPEYTAVVLLCDKEEIGSVGATGMDSFFFENTIAEMISSQNGNYNDLLVRRSLEQSRMLSADVNSAHDPNYPDVSAPNNNMAALNRGVVISKYTGSRGKSGSSEASAEFMAQIRRLFAEGKVQWQMGELGKVDVGGGGTIALFMARYGMDVVDCGPGLLSMHAPWEVSSKLDAWMSYKGYRVFLEKAGSC